MYLGLTVVLNAMPNEQQYRQKKVVRTGFTMVTKSLAKTAVTLALLRRTANALGVFGMRLTTRRDAIRGMNMSKQMVLVARTNKVGSDSECGLGITEDEWDKLTEEEQSGYINTAIDNLVDWYVKTEG